MNRISLCILTALLISSIAFGATIMMPIAAQSNASVKASATTVMFEQHFNTTLLESGTADITSSSTRSMINYPNPFRMSAGTTIYYELEEDKTVHLMIYDMRAHLVYSEIFESGQNGGRSSLPNEIPINAVTLGTSLSSGVYFYIVMSDGDVFGKGKMAVVP